jgi:hypothetical protein
VREQLRRALLAVLPPRVVFRPLEWLLWGGIHVGWFRSDMLQRLLVRGARRFLREARRLRRATCAACSEQSSANLERNSESPAPSNQLPRVGVQTLVRRDRFPSQPVTELQQQRLQIAKHELQGLHGVHAVD